MNPARIVVVDDNTADVNLLRIALEQHPKPFILDVLENGEEALRFVREHRDGSRGFQPCVMLLDLHLPRFDGLTILKAIRQAPNLAHIRVIVLSGMASLAEREMISALGALYRQKPFDLNDYLTFGAEVLALCSDAEAARA